MWVQDKDNTIQNYQDRVLQADMKKKKLEHYEAQIKEREEILKEL